MAPCNPPDLSRHLQLGVEFGSQQPAPGGDVEVRP